MHGAIAEVGGQLQLDRPFAAGQRIGRCDRQGDGAAIEPQLQRGVAGGPAAQLVAFEALQAGAAAEAEATELLQLGVALAIEAQGAAGQLLALPAYAGVGAHHQAVAVGGQLHAGMAEEEEAAVALQLRRRQIGPGALGDQIGEDPAAAGMEQVVEGEAHRQGRAGLRPAASPAADATGSIEPFQFAQQGAAAHRLQRVRQLGRHGGGQRGGAGRLAAILAPALGMPQESADNAATCNGSADDSRQRSTSCRRL